MKALKLVPIIILVLAILSTTAIVANSSGSGFFLVYISYVILLAAVIGLSTSNISKASLLALFVATSFVSVISVTEYYSATFLPGSSTAGLTFLIMPIASIFIFTVIYALAYLIATVVFKTKGKVRLGIGVAIAIGIIYLLSSIVNASLDPRNNKNYAKRKMTKDINEARNKGVLVKELNYEINSFDSSLDVHPYLERAFRYGKDTTIAELMTSTGYPYRLGFRKFFEDDVFVFVVDKELNKFDSSNGSGFHGASGFLRNANLRDTIHLGIRRQDVVLGSIKVWD